ncbi:hypothetical protein [Gilliamella sp. Gris1-4]|uniref:hypothetical protein n=1 Tax=Gilliamella sp. Gris1-4 TaxID=3120244 RepID=UPI00080E5FF5|nr:hypothetical protein [Gilliamella apicola]OCG35882.1 hypothetical protein A9G31_07635 [Gilliamella apicola]OCG65514.1 hypothetical protein A9G39_08945 [Gilliamella apicola]
MTINYFLNFLYGAKVAISKIIEEARFQNHRTQPTLSTNKKTYFDKKSLRYTIDFVEVFMRCFYLTKQSPKKIGYAICFIPASECADNRARSARKTGRLADYFVVAITIVLISE